ncbi:MAG: thiamine diphosphokinase [Lachnospiraceae bacterium]|nr:thiamine diphosphokinase [Lachnospiraceae bacterium]
MGAEFICGIVSGGDKGSFDGIDECDLIIACDRGYTHLSHEGIKADLFVGDFDSCEEVTLDNIPRLELEKEKDDTDTLAAIRFALGQGITRLRLYCCYGGRMDHFLGNIQAAAYAASKGVKVSMCDENNEMYFMNSGSITIKKREGYSLSLLSITDNSTGVWIEGAKYPLKEQTVSNIFPIGISNDWVDDITISVKSGVIAVICCKL